MMALSYDLLTFLGGLKIGDYTVIKKENRLPIAGRQLNGQAIFIQKSRNLLRVPIQPAPDQQTIEILRRYHF